MQYKVTVTHMAFEDEPKVVADVDIPNDMPSLSRSDRNKMLSYAFKMTNHIDSDWTKNDGITMLTPGSARSTSVGDRMRLWMRKGGKGVDNVWETYGTYDVAISGFEEVK